MKAITPVIALVMLMLITTGIVGASYVWTAGIMTSNTGKSILIPVGGAYCQKNRIFVLITNSGATSNVTDNDIVVADIDGINVRNSAFFGNLNLGGLAGYWRFEDSAKDYSNYGHDGIGYGDTHTVSGGIFGSAMDFDGSGDYLSVGNLGIPSGGPATIEGWFYFRDRAKDRGVSMDMYGNFVYQHSANNNEYFVGTNDYLPWVPSKNTWYHVAITYSGDTSTARLYANGVRYNWAWQTGPHTVPAFPGIISGSGADSFNGLIDEVRVWSRVLTYEEILQLNKTNSGNFTMAPQQSITVIKGYPVFNSGKHTVRMGTRSSIEERTIECL